MAGRPASFRIEAPGGDPISSLDDWKRLAPPKREVHWQRGRSAMESARAWLGDGGGPTLPPEIAELLASQELTARFRPELAIPELVTALDDFPGEHRNHDLVVIGEAVGGRTLLAIEAKADESFGDYTVGAYLDVCSRREAEYAQRVEAARSAGRRAPRRSNAAARIEHLSAALFGPAPIGGRVPPTARPLRYQLVAALAGALLEAPIRSCNQAVLVVHEFLSDPDPARGITGTQQEKARRNTLDFRRFVAALADDAPRSDEKLVGPLSVPGSDRIPADVRFWIGKVTRRLSSAR